MKPKPKKLTKEEKAALKALISKVDESVKFILENIEHLDFCRREDLREAICPVGVNVSVTNLSDYYKISEFCEVNSIPFESNSFY
jgi:hypothetical protein